MHEIEWARLKAHELRALADRKAVVVVPGFLGSDGYLGELRAWLRRVGYRPYRSQIRRNADCLDSLSRLLTSRVQRAADETGARVHLVGHSLGGVLSRGVATQQPDLVASVTTLGSPIRGQRSHRSALRTGERVRRRILAQGTEHPDCYTGYCECPFVAAVRSTFPEDVPQLAIFTRTDGVVDWRFSRHADPALNAEVRGTHCGLVFNAQVYRRLGSFLRRTAASGAREPADIQAPRVHAA